jgi:anti-sigma B factor antagonist
MSRDIAVLKVHGQVDTDRIPAMEEAVGAALEGGATRLVFNLEQLEFINSSALGFIISVHKRMEGLNGAVALSAPSRFMASTIRTLGLDQILDVFPTDEDALRHFGADGGDDDSSDDPGGIGARLKPRRPGGSGEAPDDRLPDLG